MVIGHFYDKMWLVRCTNQTSNVCSVDHIHSVRFSVFPDYRREELMGLGWYPRGVTKTRARVIGVKNFSELLIKGKES